MLENARLACFVRNPGCNRRHVYYTGVAFSRFQGRYILTAMQNNSTFTIVIRLKLRVKPSFLFLYPSGDCIFSQKMDTDISKVRSKKRIRFKNHILQ